ncbi:MAG: ribonuclease domain-containing protein [Caldimonas sp.]
MGGLQPRRPWLLWGAGIGVAGLLAVGTLQARDSASLRGTVAVAALPVEARTVHAAIGTGGPFAYAKDGSVFGNREQYLPSQTKGYYREYTVSTPGARDRGARRIVCGGTVPVAPAACYYTADHYASFKRITP